MKISLSIFLILILIGASRSEMEFEFNCQGSNGATMSSYSYLKEPILQDSGYSRGLKAGSFNYLEKGDINLVERITYDYGNGSLKGNSTYNHIMNLDFKGEKGISEFYGKEYFKNNRAISAWKKIRYDDIDERYLNLGKKNLAKEINVRADLSMDTAPGEGYDLEYNATVLGGVMEIWDASGWTNRTGARRTDWEYNAMMYGDISVTNNLKESGPLVAHAGDVVEDWLPCCFSGTRPPTIESHISPWPVQIVIDTLEADTKIPAGCTEGNCPGYDCIYTYNQGGQRGINLGFVVTTRSLEIQDHRYRITGSQVTFDIVVANNGGIKIDDISVKEILPASMKYLPGSSYLSPNEAVFKEPKPIDNPDGTTTLTWSIGNLTSDQSKTIQFTAAAVEPSESKNSIVTASGSALGMSIVTPNKNAKVDIGPLG